MVVAQLKIEKVVSHIAVCIEKRPVKLTTGLFSFWIPIKKIIKNNKI